MKKKYSTYLIAVVFAFLLVFAVILALNNRDYSNNEEEHMEEINDEVEETIETATITYVMDDSINIKINNKNYVLNLEKNETSYDLLSLLPLQFEMEDLNNNEKYIYLSSSLEDTGDYTGTIKKGDVMLYQSNCLVIFYKDFETDYYYSRIGHIDNLPDFDSNNINVVIEQEVK